MSHIVTAVIEIAVEQRRARERQLVAADHAALVRFRQRRSQRRDLIGFLALMAGDRAGERVEQHVLAVLPDLHRQILVFQRGCKSGQNLGGFSLHCSLLGRDLCAAGTLDGAA